MMKASTHFGEMLESDIQSRRLIATRFMSTRGRTGEEKCV